MASNVSNLLKEKIVTPVANSLATQVDNKVKNGIILRKFIGVQLGESNTGCQLVKIDLNKINVKDPSYEFTLYIKAFSQKGLFNFIVNVNKTDSLQVDVKCELKNSDSNNGEVIGYYDVDAVGNTITISLLKAFVVNTSINECKFVSTKDTLNISDLDIDWSDTGNVKNDTSIDIKNKQTSENEYPISMLLSKNDAVENEMFKIITFDFSPLLANKLGASDYFTIITDLSIFNTGDFRIVLQGAWSNSSERTNLVRGYYEGIPTSVGIENKEGLFRFSTVSNTEIILLMDPAYFSIANSRVIIRNIEEFLHDHIENKDFIICNSNVEKIDTSSLVIKTINKYTIDRSTIFEANDYDGISGNGVVPHPTTSEAENKYLLGADAKWHPRKAVNDSFIDLEPDDTIKGLDIEDVTKAVSFVTFNFNNIVTKLTELSKSSTGIYFEMELETIGNLSNDYHINGKFMVNKSGLIPTTVFTSSLTKNDNLSGYLENPSEFYNEVIDTPGFYIMDSSLKTVTFALYTVFANSTVRIKDFYIHVDESVISLEDLTIEWKLLAIDKPEWVILRVQKFINGSLIPPTRIFEQMNIETPIDEADSFTLEKERVKNNGLVPAPGKYEVDNGYVLGADAKWHPRKAGNEYIANLKPTEEIKGLSETDTTKGISFVTFDFNTLSQKVVEAAPSTLQEFMINMKVLTYDLGIITISTKLSVTTAGLIACNGVLSDRGMGSNSVSFSTIYSAKLGAVTSPGFFVNDKDTKILKIALYTPIAIDGVKIIDAVVTSYSDIIAESDIVFTWELGILEKKPYKPLRSNIIYPRIDLDRELVFDQMDIETPISETDEDTLFAEQIKHNGLVPAPGKYEVNNGYYLKADGTWDNPVKVLDVIHLDPGELGEQESYRIVSLDLTKFGENDFGGNYSPDIYIDILSWKYGLFYLKIRPAWATSKKILLYTASFHMKEGDRSIYNNSNGSITPPFKIRKTNTSIELYYASDMLQTSDTIQILSYNVIPNSMVEEYNPKDHILTDWSLQKIDTTSIQLSPFNHYYLGYDTIFSSSDDPNSIINNGLVPHPTSLQEENGYYLKADGSWDLPKRGNNNSVSVVTPSEEMTSQVSSTVGITFVTFDYSKIVESLSLAVNTGSGFEGILNINTKLFGEILINFSVSLFNLNGTINKSAIAYANVGTKSTGHISQISLIQNTYGADIKTPVFIYTDSVNNICKIGLYGTASKFPVIIKDCTLNQTYTDFDVNDITITWEPTTITISEENTNDASLFTNMDWSKIFTPIANMTDPDGSYSENNLRRWKLQNNGLVPAPAKYEADQGRVLYADGTWGPIKGIIRNRTFTVTPYTDSSSTQTNDYVITEGAEDLAIAINENYSVDINIVFSGLGTKNNNNTTLTITGVTGTVKLYDYSGNPIKYITDGMSMKCTIFKNTIDNPVESMNAYCVYDIVSYPDTINGPSE